ncbi:unnamed protein product [Candida verbasci]|uniref:DNA-directed DNA polymerase n=1 Tax=Candida verbasci TaxID=1227364 RepID=A0A9W4U366_9ASCO|nr:unnamed protein product [Candida verbasci]
MITRRYLSTTRRLLQSSEQPRINQLGIQYLSNQLHKKIFPSNPPSSYLKPKHPELLEASKRHLIENNLYGKKTNIVDPITIPEFPNLVGKSLDEHFYKLGLKSSEPYKSMADEFLKLENKLPEMPKEWIMQSGWTRYEPGKEPEKVDYPLEDTLVFDVEVLYKISKYSCFATCVSSNAWYGWVNPVVEQIRDGKRKKLDWDHLIPFNGMKKEKLIIGYNISYDRARIAEEYNIKSSKNFFLDGMALHVATSGICSRQRNKWSKYNKFKTLSDDYKEMKEMEDSQSESEAGLDSESESDEEVIDMNDVNELINDEVSDDPWLLKGTPNSLKNVAKFHCNIDLNKDDRDWFSHEDPEILITHFQTLMNYCGNDVSATYEVVKKIYPDFLRRIPHPVSFGALKNLGKLILPTTRKWETYIKSAEDCYLKNRDQVTQVLKSRVDDLLKLKPEEKKKDESEVVNDPWLSQLHWTIKPFKYKKDGSLAKRQAYLSGYPEWYREINKGNEYKLSIRSRITPILLKLKWEGYPLFWIDSQGWCFKVPYDEDIIRQLEAKQYKQAKLTEDEIEMTMDQLRPSGKSYILFKIPHPDSSNKRTTIVLSKTYSRFIEDGILSSEYEYAKTILKLNNEASYWVGNRQRITDQFVVYDKKNPGLGFIIPNLATMGTITRRATENTWLTASNAKENRIGSELKSLIQAPEGYCFVGADVDSEELWIASLVGDSMFQIHGGTALGWMCLEGSKNEGTDLHSKTANILNISRNNAKIFNYGRIYGAGIKFATSLLKQFNSRLLDDEANNIAKTLYEKTKGSKIYKGKNGTRGFYYGGSESIMFNALEAIANQKEPKTPVLGARVTDALSIDNLKKNTYMPSRVNWTIQSSGVDYLHLLIVSMDYLIEKYGIDARLAITVHDELRYLVKESDKYIAALCLQIANVWTRCMFSEQLGILEIPQSCAFFSDIDIDHVLRKEVSLTCKSPSNPYEIEPGESLNINQLLDKLKQDKLNGKPLTLRNVKYSGRGRIIDELDDNKLEIQEKIAKINLQISTKDEIKINLKKYNTGAYKNEIDEKGKRRTRKAPTEFDLETKDSKSYGLNKTPVRMKKAEGATVKPNVIKSKSTTSKTKIAGTTIMKPVIKSPSAASAKVTRPSYTTKLKAVKSSSTSKAKTSTTTTTTTKTSVSKAARSPTATKAKSTTATTKLKVTKPSTTSASRSKLINSSNKKATTSTKVSSTKNIKTLSPLSEQTSSIASTLEISKLPSTSTTSNSDAYNQPIKNHSQIAAAQHQTNSTESTTEPNTIKVAPSPSLSDPETTTTNKPQLKSEKLMVSPDFKQDSAPITPLLKSSTLTESATPFIEYKKSTNQIQPITTTSTIKEIYHANATKRRRDNELEPEYLYHKPFREKQ